VSHRSIGEGGPVPKKHSTTIHDWLQAQLSEKPLQFMVDALATEDETNTGKPLDEGHCDA
jgi:hypothetical protein